MITHAVLDILPPAARSMAVTLRAEFGAQHDYAQSLSRPCGGKIDAAAAASANQRLEKERIRLVEDDADLTSRLSLR